MAFIRRFARDQGYPPTIREIGRGIGIRSLRGVTVHLEALVRKGYLRRGRQARGLRIVHDPSPSVVPLPIVGRIAAGQPMLAEGAGEESLVVDRRFAPAAGCFVVRVHGDSMVEVGIHHGDFCVIRPQPTVENGGIAAVLIEGEATVKRFYRERGAIRLTPENRAMAPIIVKESALAGRDIRILGRVVGVMRKL